MNRRLDSSAWANILHCYSGFGRPVSSLGKDISHLHCERWRNAVMSPFFLRAGGSLESQLARAEAHFRRHGSKHPYDAAGAYVNLLGVDSSRNRRVLEAARKHGWSVDPRPNTLNVWRNRLPLALSNSFHLIVGRYFDAAVYRGFRRTMVENFGTKPRFMRELDAMMRGIDERVRTVLLCHESGKIAGGGLVATGGPGAFLFCGSIDKAYRGEGLWTALVAARQMVSAGQGARYWITTTHTKAILGKGDFSFPMTVLTKGLTLAC